MVTQVMNAERGQNSATIEDTCMPDRQAFLGPNTSPNILKRLGALALSLASLPLVNDVIAQEPLGSTPALDEKENSTAFHDSSALSLIKDQFLEQWVTVNGDVFHGRLTGITAHSFNVTLPLGEQREIPRTDILSFTSASAGALGPNPNLGSEARVTLRDGSVFGAAQEEVHGTKMEIRRSWSSTPIVVNDMDLRSIQFIHDPLLDAKWDAIVAGHEAIGDQLVIKKENRLAVVEGVVMSISPTHVAFRLDGEEYKVSRSKVFGISFYPGGGKEVEIKPSPLVRVCGDTVAFRDVSIGAFDTVHVLTSFGDLSLLGDWTYTLDFAPVLTTNLQDLTPEVRRWNPLEFKQTLEARRDAVLFGNHAPIEAHEQGLVIDSGTFLQYQLNDAYSRLETTIKVADLNGSLVLMGDGKMLMPLPVDRGEVNSEEQRVRFDLSGIRVLTVEAKGSALIVISDPVLLNVTSNNSGH